MLTNENCNIHIFSFFYCIFSLPLYITVLVSHNFLFICNRSSCINNNSNKYNPYNYKKMQLYM